MSDLPGLDLDAFRRWYDGVRPGEIDGDLSGELIAGGKSNLTYVVTDGSSDWIVRRPPRALGHDNNLPALRHLNLGAQQHASQGFRPSRALDRDHSELVDEPAEKGDPGQLLFQDHRRIIQQRQNRKRLP